MRFGALGKGIDEFKLVNIKEMPSGRKILPRGKSGVALRQKSSAERSGFEGALNKGFGAVRASKVVLIN